MLSYENPSHYLSLLFFSRLKDLQARDEAKAANERAKNMLETHVYDMREKLFSDEGVLLSTEEEREKIDQALNEASDWLDDEGWDSTADVRLKSRFLKSSFNLVPRPSLQTGLLLLPFLWFKECVLFLRYFVNTLSCYKHVY